MKKIFITFIFSFVAATSYVAAAAAEASATSATALTNAIGAIAPRIGIIKNIPQCATDLTNCIEKLTNPDKYPAPLKTTPVGMCDPNEHEARVAIETLKDAVNTACIQYSQEQNKEQWLSLLKTAQQNLSTLQQ